MSARQAGEGQRADQEPEVAQSDVRVAAHQQEAMYMASCALPGIRSLNSGARYFGQSEIITSANLSSPNAIGATANATRRSMNACAAGSRPSRPARA